MVYGTSTPGHVLQSVDATCCNRALRHAAGSLTSVTLSSEAWIPPNFRNGHIPEHLLPARPLHEYLTEEGSCQVAKHGKTCGSRQVPVSLRADDNHEGSDASSHILLASGGTEQPTVASGRHRDATRASAAPANPLGRDPRSRGIRRPRRHHVPPYATGRTRYRNARPVQADGRASRPGAVQ